MANLNELKDALLHTLAAKGSLGQIKARIRSEIFSALDSTDDTAPKAPLSNTNLLINELIREYLQFNQYRYSLNVFLPESNQPEVPPFDRSFISKELHVQENQHSVQIPLLYSVIALLQQNRVGEGSTAGVPMIDESGYAAAPAASASPHQPLASSLSSSHASSNAQPGHAAHSHSTHAHAQLSHRSTRTEEHAFEDAPRPMHFVQRA